VQLLQFLLFHVLKMNSVVLVLFVFVACAHGGDEIIMDGLNGTQLFQANGKQFTVSNENYGLPQKFASVGVFLNGQAYFIGGKKDGNYSAEVHMFNPETTKTTPAPSMANERASHAATVLNDTILVCGGQSANLKLSVCEMYSLTHNNWTTVHPLPNANMEFSMSTLSDGYYSFGGYRGGVHCGATNNVNRYDGTQWIARAPLPNPTRSHATIALDDNRVLLCGGWSIINNTCQMTSDCFVYEAKNDKWVIASPMSIPRQLHSMVMLNGAIYIMGGEEVNGGKTIEIYNTGGVMINAQMNFDMSMAAVAIESKYTTTTAAPPNPTTKAGNMLLSTSILAIILLSILSTFTF